jgi:hypothetical protein
MTALILFVCLAAAAFAVFKYAIPRLKGGSGAAGSKPGNSGPKSRE